MKKGLFKSVSIIMLLLVTFFSFLLGSYAASFSYGDFNWEEFVSQNKNYWIDVCEEDDEDCVDEILESKKGFYTRLYELLAKVPASYGYINDNYIIATVFYGLDPDSFRDPVEGEDNPYNLDAEDSPDKDKYIADINEEEVTAAKEYFNKETDTLKTLVNSFIGYESICLGDDGTMADSYKDSTTGNTVYKCPSNEFSLIGEKCYSHMNVFKGSFFDSIGLVNDNEKKCQELCSEKGVTYYKLDTSSTKKVNTKFFFDFLETSDYFDKKAHLRDEFSSVLDKTDYDTMDEFYKKATLEEKEKFKEEIIKCRKSIIRKIKDIIEEYGEENFSNVSENFNSVNSKMHWWPIGSDDVNEADNVLFANSTPSSINITSSFGVRVDPITGERNSQHNGIDISGELGVTNVIASKDGVISSVVSNCLDGEDQTCGAGFGNYIIIQHIDNNYSVYAHLAAGSVSLNVGESVKQGQVIAKMGNSGRSTGTHLHYEVRIGGNDSASAVDPLLYVSPDNPRPTGTSSQILEWIGNMEGTGPMEGNNYKVYADSGGVLTVGHGITLIYNADQFLAHGINPNTLSVGSLVPKNIVDSIYEEDVNGRLDNIRALLSSNGLTLSENQIAALGSLQFNCGNINGFFENYERYGSSEALCTNWWEEKALHDASGNYLSGLKKRRIAECDLFVNGNFNMNVYG